MSNTVNDSNVVQEMLGAYENSQLIYVAAKLGIADFLSDGSRPSEELAKTLGVNARALRRVMRGLVNRGILNEESPGCFGLMPAGECLKSNASGDFRGIAINVGELLYSAWGSLLYSVKTGKPAFEHIHGTTWFDYLEKNPEHARIFDRGMAHETAYLAEAVLSAYDFSDIGTLADIGGGQGVLLAKLLNSNPRMKGILFEAKSVIAGASPLLARADLADRCQLVAGDFFDSVPANCDTYVLKSIIHDWDDERAIQILSNCRFAMGTDSKILLIEPVLPEKVHEFSIAVEMDLGMMLLLNGFERTAEEYRALYASAGFELTRIIPTSTPICLIEGKLNS